MTALGELCCVAFSLCCVVLPSYVRKATFLQMEDHVANGRPCVVLPSYVRKATFLQMEDHVAVIQLSKHFENGQ